MDAFDADVLIYAAAAGHPLGERVRALFPPEPGTLAGLGSVLLLPELLAKPLRDGGSDEVSALVELVARLDLRPVDSATAELATYVAVAYRLRALDAAHLATALIGGADRFITDNRRDFTSAIVEIEVVYPDALPSS